MSQYLPFEGFKQVESWNIENVKEDFDLGHIFEVDIEYPKELHDLNNDYPFCSKPKIITSDMLSNYRKKLQLNILKIQVLKLVTWFQILVTKKICNT